MRNGGENWSEFLAFYKPFSYRGHYHVGCGGDQYLNLQMDNIGMLLFLVVSYYFCFHLY